MTNFPVFDGHNDLVLRLLKGDVTAEQVTQGVPDGHIDTPRAIKGGFGGGIFAIFVPNPDNISVDHEAMKTPPYALPLPPPITE